MIKAFNHVESPRTAEAAVYDRVVPAGEGWMHELKPGQVLRIVDMEGNQAADTLFYDADNPEDHYSAVRTIHGQNNLYLTTGSRLLAESGKELVTIVADTCGDTIRWAGPAPPRATRSATPMRRGTCTIAGTPSCCNCPSIRRGICIANGICRPISTSS